MNVWAFELRQGRMNTYILSPPCLDKMENFPISSTILFTTKKKTNIYKHEYKHNTKNMIQIIVGNIKNKRMQSYYHNNKSSLFFIYILFHILSCTLAMLFVIKLHGMGKIIICRAKEI